MVKNLNFSFGELPPGATPQKKKPASLFSEITTFLFSENTTWLLSENHTYLFAGYNPLLKTYILTSAVVSLAISQVIS